MRKCASIARLASMAVALLLGGACTVAQAQAQPEDWPTKPIRIVVSFAPGGLTDLIARSLLPALEKGFNQHVYVDNRPGAGGTLAEGLVAKSPADGYTILLSADSIAANPHLVTHLPYDMLKDLTPIALVARIPLVMLVNNDVPVKTVKEFVAYAKARNNVSYGSPGIGTSNHLYFEIFKDQTGLTNLPHIPYKGGGPAMADLMGGHIQALFISSTLAVPQVTAGKARALAVTSDKRLAKLPDVPTFAEAGFPNFAPQQWTGLFVPAGTPAAVVARIHAVFDQAVKDPAAAARLQDLDAEPVMSSQPDFARFVSKESDSLGKLIHEKGITVD
jgi:tripartite-type tricarboxylate transporter receptor subunit TctC